MIQYDEGKSVEFGNGINDANNEYFAIHGTHINDGGMTSVMSQRCAWDYYVGGLDWETAKTKHLNEYRDQYGLPHLGPTPPSFKPAPHVWQANMCGVRIPGLPAVPGGAADPSLLLSWFYDRYDSGWRAAIRGQWQVKDYTHVLLSWPDSRSQGATPQSFLATCQELIADGLYPCVMLTSKDFDPHDVPTLVEQLTPVLQTLVGTVPMFCIGWELSIWLSPTQVQQLIDALTPLWLVQPGTLGYVHFQEGYPSFQQPGGTVADFWNPNVGKLTGLLYQKRLDQNDAQFLDSIKDCLERFNGGWGMVKGFDFVALELTAALQFNGSCSEEEGNRVGRVAINAPPVGDTKVMGSGNGH